MLRWQDLNGGQRQEEYRGRYWLGLRAMIQYLLTSLPHLHTPNLHLLFGCAERQGGGEGVVGYHYKLGESKYPDFLKFIVLPVKYKVVLEVSQDVPPASSAITDVGINSCWRLPSHHQIHIIDNVSTCRLSNETEIDFLLPMDHGPPSEQVHVHLWSDFQTTPLGLLSEWLLEDTPVPLPTSLCTEEKAGSSREDRDAVVGVRGKRKQEVRLAALCEFEDHYEATLEVEHCIKNHVDVRWPAGKGATWHVDLSMGM